jgi:8-oxo-dGTP diphosphatase
MSTDQSAFLKGYNPEKYERPSVTVDLVIFTVVDSDLKVLLIKRSEHPFKGVWALPGGFVQVSNEGSQGEDLETAAHRELAEETGLTPRSCFLEQLYTFGRAGRDPRMRVVSVAWYALIPPEQATSIHAGDEAEKVGWFSASDEVPWMRMAFDHAEILQMGVERIQGKINYTDIAFELVRPTFTVGELRDVYEAIQGRSHDARNFRRRFQRLIADGVVEQAPGKRHLGKSRPAKVWRFKRRKTNTSKS